LFLHPPPTLTLFPYTTLFRSAAQRALAIAIGTRAVNFFFLRYAADQFPACFQADFGDIAEEHLAGAELAQIGPLGAVRHRSDRRSEEHTSELQSLRHLVCRLL